MIYVERRVDGRTCARALVLAWTWSATITPGLTSLIRATEGTIVERLPPRMRIREGPPWNCPHILVLIDDPERTVIEPLAAAKCRAARSCTIST